MMMDTSIEEDAVRRVSPCVGAATPVVGIVGAEFDSVRTVLFE